MPDRGKQSMNYLQYAFYAINIYLEKIFVGEIPVRVNLAIWPRARKFGVSATLVLQKAVASSELSAFSFRTSSTSLSNSGSAFLFFSSFLQPHIVLRELRSRASKI